MFVSVSNPNFDISYIYIYLKYNISRGTSSRLQIINLSTGVFFFFFLTIKNGISHNGTFSFHKIWWRVRLV